MIDLLAVIYYTIHSRLLYRADHGQCDIYEVIETNADVEYCKLIYQTFCKDLAETVMHKAFIVAGFEKDFVVIDRNSFDIVSYCFTERTKALRGECQG